MKVQLVNIRHTSQICSECRCLDVQNLVEKEYATRSTENSKHFSCSHPIHASRNDKTFHLDADLNAARNIDLSPLINSFQFKDFRATPALA
ncbi:MAG: zinc ribbon domain-containing protein [Promethearchaeota archaeon]